MSVESWRCSSGRAVGSMLLVSLLLGVLTTVGVSWWLAAFAYPYAFVGGYVVAGRNAYVSEEAGAKEISAWAATAAPDAEREALPAPPWSVLRYAEPPERALREQATGWPMLAMYSRREYTSHEVAYSVDSIWFDETERIGSIGVAARKPHTAADYQTLPLIPMWRGFAVNTALACVSWLVVLRMLVLPRAVWRWWRRRAGRCAGCGFDLRFTSSAQCTECGLDRRAPLLRRTKLDAAISWVVLPVIIVGLAVSAWVGHALMPTLKPLHRAAFDNDVAEIERLLEAGFDVDEALTGAGTALEGMTPLSVAVSAMSRDAAAVLLAHGADTQAVDPFGRPVMIAATMQRGAPLLPVLLDHGEDPNRHYWKSSVLRLSTSTSSPAVVEKLIDSGAQFAGEDDRESLGKSIGWNVEHGPAMIDLLISHGMLDLADPEVFTNLMIGLAEGQHVEAAQRAIERRAEVVAGDPLDDVQTEILRSVDSDRIESFIELGLDPTATDAGGLTALHDRDGYTSSETVRVLVEHGADVNAGDVEGVTPLMSAAALDQGELVEFLIKHGADIDARDVEGWTAYIWAADGRHYKVMSLLERLGADTSITDHEGHDASWYFNRLWEFEEEE
jgi:ankyrin repeat protein